MHSTALPAPFALVSPTDGWHLRVASIAGSVGNLDFEVRLPVGIDRLTLLIELTVRCELVLIHPRGGLHDRLGAVEHEQVRVRGYLEVIPGNRNVFFIDPENPAPADHQIGDFARLRTYHQVFDAAESIVLRVAHVRADQ